MKYEMVTTTAHLQKWVDRMARAKLIAIDTETTGKDPMKCDLVGVCLSVVEDGNTPASYIPVGHTEKACQGIAQLPLDTVLDAIRPYTEDKSKQKILQNAIYDMTVLGRYDVEFSNVDDTMWMSFALKAGSTGHGMDEIAELYLNHRTIKFNEVVLEHPLIEMQGFQDVQLHHATYYAAEDTEVTLRLFLELRKLLKQAGLWRVYQDIDRPLIPAAADMKRNGIAISKRACNRLTAEWSPIIEASAIEVQKFAPGININSPPQLQTLLFKTLDLPVVKLTKEGNPSTDAETLELLRQYHPVADQIGRYKKYSKLLGTYSQALPEMINPNTGRIHGNLNFTFTDTARLSSSDPNLQNIPSPAKGEEGAELRRAFCAPKGLKIVAADYSQIELRILAHVTEDKTLIKAFRDGEDIHTRTAGTVFDHEYEHMMWVLEEENGKPLRHDHPEFKIFKGLRRNAKTINFGLIYGMSAHGLSKQLKIDEDTAQTFIDTYFEKMTGVTDWIERIRRQAKRDRHVDTIYGRRLYTNMGFSKREQAYAERQGGNYVIQGSAADLMRLAMSAVRAALIREKVEASLLLSVHDELLLEAREEYAEAAKETMAREMRNAGGDTIDWRVPILVDAKIGDNWAEAH